MATALVLSGGGAKGSFQVGALEYLYERGFVANIICGTSVGAVNGLQLAHGGTVASQAAAFNTLRTVWQTEMTFNEDMYVEAPWLAGVSRLTRTAIANIARINLPQLAAHSVFFPPYGVGLAASFIADIVEVYKAFERASSLFTLAPTRDKIVSRLNSRAVAASGVELRLVAVSLDSGAIRYITQHGRVIETDGTPLVGFGADLTVCERERRAFIEAMNAKHAAAQALARARADRELPGDEDIDHQQVAEDAERASAALQSCMADAQAQGTATSLTVSLVEGTIASSSIPCAFPPVMLGDEAYVDGGLRGELPLMAALAFDPEAVVAIGTSPGGVPAARRAFRDATILDIAERSVIDIELWEAQDRQVQAARLDATDRGTSVWIVRPRFEVHDTLTIDPGLIDINIGYGYMCAADATTAFGFGPLLRPDGTVLDHLEIDPNDPNPPDVPSPDTSPRTLVTPLFVDTAVDPVLAKLADAITRCRRRCWEIEHRVFGQRVGGEPLAPKSETVSSPDPNSLDYLRSMKTLLGLLVHVRRAAGGRLPPDASGWADRWERHRWVPSDTTASPATTPWDRFAPRAGVRERATRLNFLIAKAPDQPDVYFVDDQRHWIPDIRTLDQYGGSRVVVEIPAELLNAIPRGDDVRFVADLTTVTSANAAQFVSQTVSQAMVTGQSQTVTVTMKNTGTSTWTIAGAFRLGSQNPPDNLVWGLNRQELPADVAPAATVTFQFTIRAPTQPGGYRFQWRMVQELVEWFGDYTPDVPIGVSPPASMTTVPDVREMGRAGADNAIRAADLVPTFNGPSTTDSRVASQSPFGGKVVSRGTTVTCQLRRGPIS